MATGKALFGKRQTVWERSLASLREVAQRREGSEWTAGGSPEPERDRARRRDGGAGGDGRSARPERDEGTSLRKLSQWGLMQLLVLREGIIGGKGGTF